MLLLFFIPKFHIVYRGEGNKYANPLNTPLLFGLCVSRRHAGDELFASDRAIYHFPVANHTWAC